MSICLHRFLLACMRVFKFYFIFIIFCFILLYPRVDPSPSVILLTWICSLQGIFPLSLYAIFCIQQVEIYIFFLTGSRWNLYLSPFTQHVSYVRLPPAAFETLKIKLEINYVWGPTIIGVYIQ